MSRDPIGEELAAWGKVALLETRGRRSGRPARATVGFVANPDGSLGVAAGDPEADWALNLAADPHCTVAIGGRSVACVARELEGDERATVVRELILRYGAPAEGLGSGPAFRLVPGERAMER